MPEQIYSVGNLARQFEILGDLDSSSKYTTFFQGRESNADFNFASDLSHVLQLKSAERDILNKLKVIHFRFVDPLSLTPSTLHLMACWAGMYPKLERLHLFGLRTRLNDLFPLMQAFSRRCPLLRSLVIGTQEYDIKTFLAQNSIIFPCITVTSLPPSPYATFSDLVDDVMQIILSILGRRDLYTLLMVNRHLHRSVLPSFLEGCNAKWSSNTLRMRLFPSYGTLDALSGLSISPIITSLDRLSCTIPYIQSAHLLILHIHRLHQFIASLETCKEVELIFEDPSFPGGSARLCEIWDSCLVNFMKRALERNCTKLHVRGGRYFDLEDRSSAFTLRPFISTRISRVFLPEPPHPPACLFRQFGEPNTLFRSTGGKHHNRLQSFTLASPMLERYPIKPALYEFFQNSPHLTHLDCHLPDSSQDCLSGFIGAFKHLTHFTGSGDKLYVTSLHQFLASVPALTYLRVSRLILQPALPLPPPNLPNVQVLFAGCAYICYLMSAKHPLPKIKSIGIQEHHFARVPWLPSPELLIQTYTCASSHPNSPELFIDLNLTEEAAWMPHELENHAKTAGWAEASSLVTKLVFRNVDTLRKTTPYNEIDYDILLQVIELFPSISHVQFLETGDVPRTPQFDRSFKTLSDRLSDNHPSLIWNYDSTFVDTI
ncbi:hypothetical protein BDN72DRAFT_958658 [Pluteus cervinus]|uniref:Uncharacterized protein n=1 Tax=Pluteus cervinus TaxID=181527 RepID=A0ACD3AY95_9AGAR|nr:hypothetical protein BDN72DRAFT_958658 [Pluteus cervinus]